MDYSSDSSFKKFLQKVTNQNNRSGSNTEEVSSALLDKLKLKNVNGVEGTNNNQVGKLVELEKETSETSEKQLDEVIKVLQSIRKSLSGSSGGNNSNAGGLATNAVVPKDQKSVSSVVIKDSDKTFRETIKEDIGAVKTIGNNVVSGFKSVGSGVKSAFQFGKKAFTNPKEALKQVSSKVGSFKESAKDILGTEAGYTAESERYGKEYQVAGMGTLEEGKEKYREKVEQEENENRVEKNKKQGNLFGLSKEGKFAPSSYFNESLNKQESTTNISNNNKVSNNTDLVSNNVKSQTVNSTGPTQNTQPNTNAESDNIESPVEIISKTSKETVSLITSSVELEKEQLGLLKVIAEQLQPKTPSELPEQKVKSVASSANNETAAAPVESGPGINLDLDIDGPDRRNPKGKKPSIGSRILGGLGKAARVLGPAAAVAGAAYSGFEGYQNTTANFDVKEGQEATTGQKISSTLGGVASGLTFGLLNEKSAAQGIHKAGSAISDFFGGTSKPKGIEQVPPAVDAMGNITGTAPSYAGKDVMQTSIENVDMSREVAAAKSAPAPSIVSSNVSNNNSTSFVPIKPTPRPEYSGSALDRYQGRVSVY